MGDAGIAPGWRITRGLRPNDGRTYSLGGTRSPTAPDELGTQSLRQASRSLSRRRYPFLCCLGAADPGNICQWRAALFHLGWSDQADAGAPGCERAWSGNPDRQGDPNDECDRGQGTRRHPESLWDAARPGRNERKQTHQEQRQAN